MNLILVNRADITESREKEDEDGEQKSEVFKVLLVGRQAQHCVDILKVKIGSFVRIGVKNGGKGSGVVTAVGSGKVEVQFDQALHRELPEEGAPLIDLLIALPRPKTFDKLLQYTASLGVGRLLFVCSTRVEKSYFSSPKLTEKAIHTSLQLGLEQSEKTRFPEVHVYASWKALMNEMKKGHLIHSSMKLLLADPWATSTLTQLQVQQHESGGAMIAIGPEGGWISSEIEDLHSLGFQSFTMGSNILRCEVATTVLVGQVQLLLNDPVLRQDLAPPARNDYLKIVFPPSCWNIFSSQAMDRQNGAPDDLPVVVSTLAGGGKASRGVVDNTESDSGFSACCGNNEHLGKDGIKIVLPKRYVQTTTTFDQSSSSQHDDSKGSRKALKTSSHAPDLG